MRPLPQHLNFIIPSSHFVHRERHLTQHLLPYRACHMIVRSRNMKKHGVLQTLDRLGSEAILSTTIDVV
ncbi:MAG: hypothetical protein Ct9H300mP11_24720 [Chloroflexota bacterium]|nr:MAG: hypothetical protein Ct9H300mP11_24720 [Chloroflexota bacterium]